MQNFPEILTSCRFYIELKLEGSLEPVDAYFLECKGFKNTQDVVEVCEVTPLQWGKAKSGQMVRTKVPGNFKANNITLRRGMTKSKTLWKWFEEVQTGNWAKQLRDGSLSIYNQSGEAEAIFQFRGAWPVSYMASDLLSNSTEIEVEEMEIAVEMFKREK
ncbi:phage tail protein [Anabaena sphaerica FACHB-251]|uniref:Phage tail protein n=1 Tax=Anabaena sphaerica FACHB-251 TaxID=2692883 RepID=A0A926WKP5_9NOST|nr:phage tail protein [Anabaena sphaerica]MBD2296364.1 phage tail protein [Anabaena sphaerica FACHB-251]